MVPDVRKIFFGENKFSCWIIIRKGHKMLAVLLARRWCKSPEIFVYSKECRKNAWSRWGSGLLTLHEYASSIIFYVQLKVYKLLWKIKLWALLTEAWSPRVILSFLLFLFRLTPWSAGALWVHFSAWASKTHLRRCPRWGIFSNLRGHLWPTWTVQVPCWGFIGFLCKPRNISLFLSSIFLTATFILSFSHYLFISLSPMPSLWG